MNIKLYSTFKKDINYCAISFKDLPENQKI